jgi:hypothetical protein
MTEDEQRAAFEAWFASEAGSGDPETIWLASRRAALEDAAKLCDGAVDCYWYGEGAIAAISLAAAIRDLSEI